MASCNFNIPFAGSAQEILIKAKNAVQSQGGSFDGDTNAGNFHVSVFGNTITGSYSVTGQVMEVVIDSKPFLLPCSAIEGFLKSQIGA